MSEYRDYIEQNYDDILVQWQKYIIEINKVRSSFGLPDRVFQAKKNKNLRDSM